MQLSHYFKKYSTRIPYLMSNYISHEQLSPSYSYYALSLVSNIERKYYAEASKHGCWKQDMMLELLALKIMVLGR